MVAIHECVLALLAVAVTGCASDPDEDEAQRLREQELKNEIGDVGEDLARTGEDVGEVAKEAGQEIKEATKDVGDAIGNRVKAIGDDLGDAAVDGRVRAAFARDTDLRDRGIHITTVDGVVTVTGAVPSLRVKLHATSVATDIKGVGRVETKLEIHD